MSVPICYYTIIASLFADSLLALLCIITNVFLVLYNI